MAVWPFVYDFLQLGIDSHWAPTEPERDVDRVHTQVSHYPDLAAGLYLAFPINLFRRIQIAAVMKPDPNFERLPISLLLNKLDHFLGAPA